MKLVREHMNEAIKHLKPRSEAEMKKLEIKRITELSKFPGNKLIDGLYQDIRDLSSRDPVSRDIVTRIIVAYFARYTDPKIRKKVIQEIYNNYVNS